MKKHKWITISLITTVLMIATTYLIGSLLSAPMQRDIGVAPVDLPIEEVTITTERGNKLSAWYISGKQGMGAVLLMHGVRSTRLQMLERARFIHRAGYAVLLFDFQAHGESHSEQITFGYREAHDVTAAYQYMKQRLPNERVAVIGVSLGGAATLLSPVGEQADALILEAVYSDLQTAIANRLAIRLGEIGRHLAPLLSWQIKPRLGFEPEQLAPIKQIAKIKTPILMVAGGKDQHTRLAESKEFYELAQQPKQIWVLPEASHVDFHQYAPEKYQQKILEFLSIHL